MSPEVNADDVDRRLERLRETWGDFPVEQREESAPPEAFKELLAVAREGYTGGGYVWVVREPDQTAPLTESMPDVDDEERVLLGLGRGSDTWGPAGGGREDGETYEEAAVREVAEETGIECSISAVGGAGRFVTTCADDSDERIHTLYVAFEGEYEGGHIEVQPSELNGAAWWRELPANLHPIAEPLAEGWNGGRVTPEDGEAPPG